MKKLSNINEIQQESRKERRWFRNTMKRALRKALVASMSLAFPYLAACSNSPTCTTRCTNDADVSCSETGPCDAQCDDPDSGPLCETIQSSRLDQQFSVFSNSTSISSVTFATQTEEYRGYSATVDYFELDETSLSQWDHNVGVTLVSPLGEFASGELDINGEDAISLDQIDVEKVWGFLNIWGDMASSAIMIVDNDPIYVIYTELVSTESTIGDPSCEGESESVDEVSLLFTRCIIGELESSYLEIPALGIWGELLSIDSESVLIGTTLGSASLERSDTHDFGQFTIEAQMIQFESIEGPDACFILTWEDGAPIDTELPICFSGEGEMINWRSDVVFSDSGDRYLLRARISTVGTRLSLDADAYTIDFEFSSGETYEGWQVTIEACDGQNTSIVFTNVD